MNDPLEMKLQSLRRSELPAEWKVQMLGKAPRMSLLPMLAPPRWLAWSLTAAWALVFTLHGLTPVAKAPPQKSVASEVSTRALQLRREMLQSLLAANLSNTP